MTDDDSASPSSTQLSRPGHADMVNLGCGSRVHAAFRNYDLSPMVPGVRRANFLRAVPLPDRVAQVVYHSHVLEHLPLDRAISFLRECFRVLAPGGVLRVVVPDFEQSARDYLKIIDRRRAGENLKREHRWMLVELFDQMVRRRPGGEFAGLLARGEAPLEFVRPRIGSFGANLYYAGGMTAPLPASRFVRVLDWLERWVPSPWGHAAADALFRTRGEVHLWMYDEPFLADILRDIGFAPVNRVTHTTSRIPDWSRYGLDAEPDGQPYKGMSLYMEALRPV